MEEEKPTLSELMISQLEIANVIVVNKKDLVTKEQLEKVNCYLKSINPNSEIISTTYSNVNLKNLL
jgi:G3E family GTPase